MESPANEVEEEDDLIPAEELEGGEGSSDEENVSSRPLQFSDQQPPATSPPPSVATYHGNEGIRFVDDDDVELCDHAELFVRGGVKGVKGHGGGVSRGEEGHVELLLVGAEACAFGMDRWV